MGPADSIRRALVYAQEGNVLGPREAAVALAELSALEAERTALRAALGKIRLSTNPPIETLKTARFELRAIRGVVDRALGEGQ